VSKRRRTKTKSGKAHLTSFAFQLCILLLVHVIKSDTGKVSVAFLSHEFPFQELLVESRAFGFQLKQITNVDRQPSTITDVV